MNRRLIWTGRALSGLVMVAIGLIELACLALYLLPRTSVIGAILWTGYLGGAVASHLRHGDGLFGFVLAPVHFAAVLWGGLWLSDGRVRALVAPATPAPSRSALPAGA